MCDDCRMYKAKGYKDFTIADGIHRVYFHPDWVLQSVVDGWALLSPERSLPSGGEVFAFHTCQMHNTEQHIIAAYTHPGTVESQGFCPQCEAAVPKIIKELCHLLTWGGKGNKP
jgi:hypothetical protein